MDYSGLKQLLGDICPGKAAYTEEDYADQTGRVFIVTGGPTGIGFHVTRFLLQKNAKVWIVARNQTKIDSAIEKLREEFPDCKLHSFVVDFEDLSSIKPGVQNFLDNETRLDGIVHNAGVMLASGQTKQQYERHLGVNNLGPHLLQTFLDDIIIRTAQQEATKENSTRIVWISASAITLSPKNGGIYWEDINYKKTRALAWTRYAQSKAINIYQAIVWAKKHPNSGVVTISCDPGLLKSELQRNASSIERFFMNRILFPTHYGAYSELYGLLHPSFTTADNGTFVIPWGKQGHARKDIVEGANGDNGEKIWNWMEEQVAEYR